MRASMAAALFEGNLGIGFIVILVFYSKPTDWLRKKIFSIARNNSFIFNRNISISITRFFWWLSKNYWVPIVFQLLPFKSCPFIINIETFCIFSCGVEQRVSGFSLYVISEIKNNCFNRIRILILLIRFFIHYTGTKAMKTHNMISDRHYERCNCVCHSTPEANSSNA